ncbi:MAG: hypothetical protein MUF61_01880 [archaeon]|jgi:energy-converting hydrogenase Eha subunit H|nr:hypothetical protein [archaeon]
MEVIHLLLINMAFLVVLLIVLAMVLSRSRKTEVQVRVDDDIAKIKEQIDPDYEELAL